MLNDVVYLHELLNFVLESLQERGPAAHLLAHDLRTALVIIEGDLVIAKDTVFSGKSPLIMARLRFGVEAFRHDFYLRKFIGIIGYFILVNLSCGFYLRDIDFVRDHFRLVVLVVGVASGFGFHVVANPRIN